MPLIPGNTSGPCTLDFSNLSSFIIGQIVVNNLRISIKTPVEVKGHAHREFHLDTIRDNNGLAADEIEEYKIRGVFGYFSWMYQLDDDSFAFTVPEYINWKETIWFPPTDRRVRGCRIWLRRGVSADYLLFKNSAPYSVVPTVLATPGP